MKNTPEIGDVELWKKGEKQVDRQQRGLPEITKAMRDILHLEQTEHSPWCQSKVSKCMGPMQYFSFFIACIWPKENPKLEGVERTIGPPETCS